MVLIGLSPRRKNAVGVALMLVHGHVQCVHFDQWVRAERILVMSTWLSRNGTPSASSNARASPPWHVAGAPSA